MKILNLRLLSLRSLPLFSTAILLFSLTQSGFGQSYDVGSLSGQNGWSGGAQPDFQNNFSGSEAVTTAAAHTGTQSWRLSDSYNSPGQGTPFSPGLSQAAGAAAPGSGINTFTATIWFKQVSLLADNSDVAIEFGDPAGDDRAAGSFYLRNDVSGTGLSLSMADNIGTSTLASGLDTSAWHELEITGTFLPGASNDILTVRLDGGTATDHGSWTEESRPTDGQEESNRLKLREFNNNNNEDSNYTGRGFYFDDISYSSFDSANPAGTVQTFSTGFEHVDAVPEPSTWALIVLGSATLLILHRRRLA